MGKLNASISEIELNTNKVIGTPSSEWSDSQYPSAKAMYDMYTDLLNKAYPINSYLITSENINPASTIGVGTWELQEHQFTQKWTEMTANDWVAQNATLSSAQTPAVMKAGNMVTFRFSITTTTTLNDYTTTLGQLNLANLGLTSLTYTMTNVPVCSDNGGAIVMITIKPNGTIEANEVLVRGTNMGSLASGAQLDFCFSQIVKYTDINPDIACNKFYWRRTA